MPTEAQIRLLDDADLDLVLNSDAFDNDADPAQTAAFLANPNHVIVGAIQCGRLIGMATGAILLHPDKQPILFVSEVGVNEDYQRQGIARKMVDDLIEHGRNVGCKGTWVATEADNEPARGLYRNLQGRETPDIVVYDWDGALDD